MTSVGGASVDGVFDDDEADTAKDDETGDYEEDLIANGLLVIARQRQDFLTKLLARAEEDARKHKLPVAKQRQVQTDLFDPMRAAINDLQATTDQSILDPLNKRFGTSVKVPDKDGSGNDGSDDDGSGDDGSGDNGDNGD